MRSGVSPAPRPAPRSRSERLPTRWRPPGPPARAPAGTFAAWASTSTSRLWSTSTGSPGNFIDEFQRSYSSDPETVAELAAAFITAQQRLGVAATAKHFPGLGSASRSQNTDVGPVTLRSSLSTLRAVDEAPYVSAIEAGVKLVMASWAVYPALDPRLPAGLSPAVIQGELRGRLGFGGVTITDGIEAGALAAFGSVGNRAVLAASAGADLILCATTNPDDNTPALGTAARNAIASALAHGRLARGAAQQSAGRILALRANP